MLTLLLNIAYHSNSSLLIFQQEELDHIQVFLTKFII